MRIVVISDTHALHKQDKEPPCFWWSMILTAISSSSTIRARLHPARLLEMKHNRPASPGGATTTAECHCNSVRYSNGWRIIAEYEAEWVLIQSGHLFSRRERHYQYPNGRTLAGRQSYSCSRVTHTIDDQRAVRPREGIAENS